MQNFSSQITERNIWYMYERTLLALFFTLLFVILIVIVASQQTCWAGVVVNTTYGSFFAQSCDINLMVYGRIGYSWLDPVASTNFLQIALCGCVRARHRTGQHRCWPSWCCCYCYSFRFAIVTMASCTAFYALQLYFFFSFRSVVGVVRLIVRLVGRWTVIRYKI